MLDRAVLHHDRCLDEAAALILARERFRRYKAEGPPLGGWNTGGARWSQASVARRLGVTGAALCMWESGRHSPATLKSWHDWAAAYKRDLADVIAEAERMRKGGAS